MLVRFLIYQNMVYSKAELFSPFAASVLPIDEIVSWAHDVGSKVLVDACQSVPHMVVDVRSLDTDFLVASSHKVFVFSHALMFNLASDNL